MSSSAWIKKELKELKEQITEMEKLQNQAGEDYLQDSINAKKEMIEDFKLMLKEV